MDGGVRSHSVPVGDRTMQLNPFHSETTKNAYLLEAARPRDLPSEGVSSGRTGPGDVGQPHVDSTSTMPSGKGRGGVSAGVMLMTDPFRSTETGSEVLRTEGRLPTESGTRDVNGTSDDPATDSLQRALEIEMVELLRQQNSKLSEEVALLRSKLESKSGVGSATSWSAVGESVNSSGVGAAPSERPGRHGSRTPRNRIREDAVSPSRIKHGFTPNGTKVPDGPPPIGNDDMPPVPPFPVPMDEQQDGHHLCSSFVSDLYDTCESKSRVKNGDTQWKPLGDSKHDVLSPSEAKQIWMEREIRSLKFALDRVNVPTTLQQSEYWNGGFDQKLPTSLPGPPAIPASFLT
eukprot:s2125_g7.t1